MDDVVHPSYDDEELLGRKNFLDVVPDSMMAIVEVRDMADANDVQLLLGSNQIPNRLRKELLDPASASLVYVFYVSAADGPRARDLIRAAINECADQDPRCPECGAFNVAERDSHFWQFAARILMPWKAHQEPLIFKCGRCSFEWEYTEKSRGFEVLDPGAQSESMKITPGRWKLRE